MDRRFRDRPFTLRQLQYAVAVDLHGAFGKAAEAAGVSQPSLSAQVAKLEELLGVKLFERLPRSVHPTTEGRTLLPLMRRLVNQSGELEAHARSAARPGAVLLRIGVIPTVAPYWLPSASQCLRETFPELTVHWVEGHTAVLERQLMDGAIDAAWIADPPQHAGLEHRVLCEEALVVLAPSTIDLPSPFPRQQLEEVELLLLEDGHCLRDHTLQLCQDPRMVESPFRATSLATLVQMVGAGLGVTVLPSCAVAVESARAPVHCLPFEGSPPTRTLRLLWRRNSTRAPAIQRLAGLLADLEIDG